MPSSATRHPRHFLIRSFMENFCAGKTIQNRTAQARSVGG